MKNKKPFDIPTINESLMRDYKSGKITAHEVAMQLYMHGWEPYIVDDEKALEKIHAK